MNIFGKIKNSIYGPQFYKDLQNKSLGFSIGYLFKLALLIALVATIIYSIVLVPKVSDFLDNIGADIIDYYPDELVMDIKDGKVSVNVPEPYFLALPGELRGELDDTNVDPSVENLLVINTKQEFSIDLFESYNTVALLGEDYIAHYDDNSQIAIISLSDVPDFTLDADKVSTWAGKIESIVKIVPMVILPIGVFLVSFFVTFIWNLIYMFFGAIVILILLKIMGKQTGYGHSYRIGLHALTLNVIIKPISELGFGWGWFWLASTILILVMVAINMKGGSQASPVQSEQIATGQ
ncbi:MAG: DUF1189 family protein [Parcubacteria group bacterium]